MKPVVVDASVAVKWYLPEPHANEACRFLDRQREGQIEIHVPDLLFAETANILWKRVRRRELNQAEAGEIASALHDVPDHVYPAAGLVSAALSLACRFDRSVYDCLYVALALALECKFVTADLKLANALAPSPIGAFVEPLAGG